MGFLSKLWENWGKGNNAGPETKPAKKAPAIKKTKKRIESLRIIFEFIYFKTKVNK